MRKKRSGLFIAAGVGCALLAVFVVKHWTGKDDKPAPVVAGTDILLASRDIWYGEQLVLEGHGDNANVIVVSGWPGDRKPEGALTKGGDITKHPVRAVDSFVKHEVILKAKTIPDEEFVPSNMKVERINVDKEDIRSGRVRPGMKADVLQIVNKEPRHFMRNVLVYAVGALDANSRPVRQKDPSPTAFLLIKSEDYLTFLKARLNTTFLLVEAADPTIEGPLLVDASGKAGAKRAEVQAKLDEGVALMATGDYEKAHPILRQAAELYPEVTDLCSQASEQAGVCRQRMAMKRYEQALRAVEQDGDYAVALHHLDTIDDEFSDIQSVARQAAELRKRAEEALAKNRSQARYAAAVKDLESSLAGGDVPRATQLVGDLKQLKDEGFKPVDATQDLTQVIADFEKRARLAGMEYENDKMVLESFLRQEDVAQARAKLEQIKAKFPRHPDVVRLEASVAAREAKP